ncbi:MAG: hypothetical protein QXM43_05825 [Desulfurococcaceae archaeon]
MGHGYKTIIESLTHDEKGYYSPKNVDYRALIKRPTLKILKRIDYIYDQDTDSARTLICY